MSHKQERIPLVGSSDPENPNIFPPLASNHPSSNGQHSTSSASYYGLIEIPPGQSTFKLKSTGWINQRQTEGPDIMSSLMTIIVVLLGIALIFTLAITFTPSGMQETTEGSQNNLRAAAPSAAVHTKGRLSQSSRPSHVDIEIPQGRLRGYKKVSRDGREYSAFYKVPYATPPIGSLRFRDPTPPSTWEGLRDNPVVAPQCIQKEKYADTPRAGGEEDCLYANVHTPRLPETSGDEEPGNLFPVMVYIHGGGYASGNGSRYGANYVMDEDIVFITFQFRLGPFGFLTTGDDLIHGNLGLRDQVQLLKWVRDNAKYFNGDPDRVTIFGNSSGGKSSGYLLLSPMARGLFHRAISQSGTSISEYGPDRANKTIERVTMEELGKAVGCPAEDSQKYRDCLLEKDAQELALVQGGNIVYDITIEDWTEGGENANGDSAKFMPEEPFKLLEAGSFHPVPYIVGNNNAEYHANALALLANENSTRMLNERFEEIRPLLNNVNLNKEEMDQVKKFYFGEERIGNQSFKILGDLISDAQIVHSSYLTARYHAKKGSAYLYWLTKPPALSYIDKYVPGFPAKELGFVSHADEIQFLFPYDGYPEIPKDDPEYYNFSKYLVKLWAHFARTGNPTMDGLEWPAVNGYGDGTSDSTYWLELGDNPAITTELQKRMGFWDKFDLRKLNYEW